MVEEDWVRGSVLSCLADETGSVDAGMVHWGTWVGLVLRCCLRICVGNSRDEGAASFLEMLRAL